MAEPTKGNLERARKWVLNEEHPPASDLYALLAAYGNFMALTEARWWAKYHGKDYNGEGRQRIAELEAGR